MSSTYTRLSARHVLHLAQVIDAVNKGARVRWYDGMTEMVGTMRGFTLSYSGAHFSGDDIRDSWIRITLTAGHDVWLETEEVVGMLEEGAISL